MAGKPRIQIDFDKIYESNSCGKFKIIENLGRDKRSRLFVRIKFLKTNTIKDVRYDIAMDGKVKDDLYDIDFNKVYKSNYYGTYNIISYVGRTRNHDSHKVVRIKFHNTGYECNVLLRLAKIGNVKDDTVPYCDRECIIDYDYSNTIVNILKERWKSMMYRCYNANCDSYKYYGGIGVSVCEYWHNVDNFISSMPGIPNYFNFFGDPVRYHLDKDYLQMNIPKKDRIYSPQTCVFLSIVDNSNLALLEKHNENSFFGVSTTGNNYEVSFTVNGKVTNFGVYSNEIAAVNEYNYYYKKYGSFEMIPLYNYNIKYMSHEEAKMYKVL